MLLSVAFGFRPWRSLLLNYSYYCKTLPNIVNNNNIALFHSSQSTDEAVGHHNKRKKEVVDWLPFEWTRRPRNDYFVNSGDLVQTLEYDPSWLKPDFELSDELKSASDEVKHIFSLASGSKAEIKEVIKRNILKRVQRHPNDLESLEVKIALKTIQIRSLFDHGRELKKEIRGSRILLHNFIHKRNKLLKQLYRMDNERFNWLVQELQLKYVPQQLGGRREMYCKKWDLRRLTKEYCETKIKDKKDAYHEELKKQQADFLKEKEEILAWIAKEENELANLTV